MRILLVGGTGVLSTDVAIEAIDSGHELYILNRGNRKSDYIALDNVIMADIRNEKQSLAAIGNNYYDVVIDFLSFNMDHLKKTMKIFQGKCKQYIFISSATVYSRNVDGRITEDTPLTNDRWAYAVKKANCETVLKDTAYLYGFEYTIIRPYITYGKTRIPFAVNSRKNQWTLIERIKQDKPVIMWDDGNAVCTLTNTKDFARAILGLCMNERAFGQAFHITSGYELTWNDVIRTYGRLLNKDPLIVYVPSEEIERSFPYLEHELTGDKGTTFIFDNSKLKWALDGFEFTVSFEEGIRETFSYYQSKLNELRPNYEWDAQIDSFLEKRTHNKYKYVPYSNDHSLTGRIEYILSKCSLTRGVYQTIKNYFKILIYKIKKEKRFMKFWEG